MTVTVRATGPALVLLPCTAPLPTHILQTATEGILNRPEEACRKHPLSRRPTTTTSTGCSRP